MGRWLLLLGGLVIWLAHFLGVYGIASVADVVANAGSPTAAVAIAAFTVVCAGGDIAILAVALRRQRAGGDDLDRFIHGGAGLGAGLSLVAVTWQGLPLMVGR